MKKKTVYEGLATGLSAVRAAEYTRHQQGDIDAVLSAMDELDKDEWISVQHNLPQRGKDVLCVTTKRTMFINTMDLKGHWFYQNGYITHWQPLPAFPR